MKTAGNAVLTPDDLLKMNDILVVLSADSVNTTMYRLDVTERGLRSDAILTSAEYFIGVDVNTGGIYNIPPGTKLTEALSKVVVPAGATLTIVDNNGGYVPFRRLNFDSTYVEVIVTQDIYFEVVAENGISRILYQLVPATTPADAYVTSEVYSVMQSDNLIRFVPRGTNFQAFLSNITPSLGATLKLVDKMGFERVLGNIREDDRVIVTSQNGLNTKVYFISFLPTQSIQSVTYLAYVLSNSYAVDQVDYTISGATSEMTGSTQVSEFISRIIPVTGATAVLVDVNGNVKTTGTLKRGDMLKVTSADQRITVYYQLVLDLTNVGLIGMEQIEIYPNPTSGILNIRGIQTGNRIQLYNATGSLILDRNASGSVEVLSVESVPPGMFIIVISNENRMIGRFKAVKY